MPEHRPASKKSTAKKQCSQPGSIRLTAEDIAETANGPHLEDIMAHFGYETIGEWNSTWINRPDQIERLSSLPEFIKLFGLNKRFRIVFDYDPAFPRMLLQATVTDPNQ